jgi:hypothetical protein
MSAGDLSGFTMLAQIAYVEATVAAVVIPAAWSIVPIIYEGQSDPGQIWLAADGWHETSDRLNQAQQRIDELTRRLGEDDWTGDDRTAFDEKVARYRDEIVQAMILAWFVSSFLYVIAIAIIIFILLMFVLATLLTVFAAAVVIAAATVVGAAGAASMEEMANSFATTCYEILDGASKVLSGICDGAAGVMAFLLGNEVLSELFDGSGEAVVDLLQATLNGSGTMLSGTLNFLEQKFTSNTMQGKASELFGRTIIPIPGLDGQKFAMVKGLTDVLDGSPLISGMLPNMTRGGTGDTDNDHRSDGDDYVDRTQPHR